MECPHLDKVIRQGQGGGGTAPSWTSLMDPSVKLECGECGASESVWICVTCGALNCGRYIKAHGLMHKVRDFKRSSSSKTSIYLSMLYAVGILKCLFSIKSFVFNILTIFNF